MLRKELNRIAVNYTRLAPIGWLNTIQEDGGCRSCVKYRRKKWNWWNGAFSGDLFNLLNETSTGIIIRI